ncbi:sigma factor binding protein 1, chloroplastic-like [Euphorbia lathyris]|uniref:sigma factor binding protein 1, chloroplastic-like n=1 Tax=Euphorbia lathyris TaxID=212925 RepID=UPI003313D11C
MENLLSTVPEIRKPSSKLLKTMKKPLKVVYISNPIKFQISASQFRALVQEFTGQHSDPSKFMSAHVAGDQNVEVAAAAADLNGRQKQQEQISDDLMVESAGFDDVFTPEMIDNLSGLMDSGLFYDSCTAKD